MSRAPHHQVRALATIADRMLGRMAGHSAAQRLHAGVNRLRQAAEALDEISAKRNPNETPEAHVKRISARARQFGRDALTEFNRSAAILREAREDAQRRINDKTDLRPPSEAAQREIRERFSALSREAKVNLMQEWIETKQGPTLAAIVKAPAPFLTGLSAVELAQYEKAMVAKHAPAELDELAGLESVFEEAVLVAMRTAGEIAKAFDNPTKVAQIEREEAEADAAEAAFNQSLQ